MGKKIIYSNVYPLGLGTESRAFVFYFGISLLIHMIIIGYLVFAQESTPRRRFSPGSINVSLVSPPGLPAPAAKSVIIPEPKVKAAVKAPVIEQQPSVPLPVPQKPKKTISLTPDKKNRKVKKSLKKKTLNRKKMIEHAVSKVQKKVENSKTNSVKQAIDALKTKVAQTEANASQTNRAAGTESGATGAGTPGAGGAGGRRALELIDIYKIEVAFQVERHWAFSEQLAGDGGALQASIVFKVLPSGEVTDIRFTERSGNSYLDESAYKAVVKASPVSPHPEGVRALHVTVAVRFTPQGIR